MSPIDASIESKAISLLQEYNGANNFILKLKQRQITNKKFFPTRTQAEYIIKNFSLTPKVARKWVVIDSYFARKFADDNSYINIPEKCWVEKILSETDKAYHIWGRFFDTEELHDFWVPKAAVIKDNTVKDVVIDYEKYNHRPPLEHQKVAIQKLVENKKFILADDMGAGKSTSATIAALESKVKKVLIICPATLKINWKREVENYSDKSIFIAEGKNFSGEEDFVIINYDILKNFHDPKNREDSKILQSNFDLIIIDESHFLKNAQSQRTKLVQDIVKDIPRIWLLTGTPITSRPIDYYTQLNMVDSPVAKNWMAYVIRYCEGYQFKAGSRKVWNVKGASNLEELRERTSSLILRRLKEDILDLPDKIITPIHLQTHSREYKSVMGEYYDWLKNNDEEKKSLTVQFSKLTKARVVIANEKVPHTIELIENALEQDKKVLVFSNFTEPVNRIMDHFGKSAVRLDGSMSQKERQKSVDDFQTNDKIKVFVGNVKASGVGITLTAAEVVIFNDISFVPADMAQAEDRSYRYGQKNNILVYYPIFSNTIESIIFDIVNQKKQIISTIMGDNLSITDATEEILNKINSQI